MAPTHKEDKTMQNHIDFNTGRGYDGGHYKEV